MGSSAWSVVLAILGLPVACAPAFLYWLCNLGVQVIEQPGRTG
jgi:hypothetical protein